MMTVLQAEVETKPSSKYCSRKLISHSLEEYNPQDKADVYVEPDNINIVPRSKVTKKTYIHVFI